MTDLPKDGINQDYLDMLWIITPKYKPSEAETSYSDEVNGQVLAILRERGQLADSDPNADTEYRRTQYYPADRRIAAVLMAEIIVDELVNSFGNFEKIPLQNVHLFGPDNACVVMLKIQK